jgi:hypothetical protein
MLQAVTAGSTWQHVFLVPAATAANTSLRMSRIRGTSAASAIDGAPAGTPWGADTLFLTGHPSACEQFAAALD